MTVARRSSRGLRSRSSLVVRWVVVGLLGLIAVAYVPPLRAYLETRDEVAARRAELTALERTNQALERRVAYAKTAAFVEREARKLGLVHPGERLFIVKRPEG